MAMSNGIHIAENKFEGFKSSGNDIINFKLIREEADVLNNDKVFKADMTHQLFGDSESVFGYKDLKIDIYCSAARMTTYIGMNYSAEINPQEYDGVKPDDIMGELAKIFQPGFLTSRDAFISYLNKEKNFKPFGELVHAYTVTKDGADRQFEVYKTGIDTPGFRDYHERLQPFLMFYVDAASYIDVDDDRWDYYLLFEKYQNSGDQMFAFAGYMTVYNYFAYPEKLRPRISQVLVLPPFQRQGHGATLIQTFYNGCYERSDIMDITVEDPSENFQRVRDFVDAKNCLKLPSYHPDKLVEGFTEEMVQEAKDKLLINRKQARRIYEILRLRCTDRSNPADYKAFRIDLKKRLNLPFKKNGRDFEKLQRALQPNELSATLNNMSTEQRMDYLEKQFEEEIKEYQFVVERLATVLD